MQLTIHIHPITSFYITSEVAKTSLNSIHLSCKRLMRQYALAHTEHIRLSEFCGCLVLNSHKSAINDYKEVLYHGTFFYSYEKSYNDGTSFKLVREHTNF